MEHVMERLQDAPPGKLDVGRLSEHVRKSDKIHWDKNVLSQSSVHSTQIPVKVVRQQIEVEFEISEIRENRPDHVEFTHPVADESFDLTVKASGVELSHPFWSVFGLGASIIEAEADLRREATEIAEGYLNFPVQQLDISGLEFRNWLLRVI